MSDRCEEFGPLLAAWAYDEVDSDEAAAVEEHLARCPACRQRRDGYLGVRADLQEWQPVEAPRTITFIDTAPVAARQPGWLSWTVRAAAVAASFVLGLGLTAAAVNLEVHHDDRGWTVTTGLWHAPTAEEAGSADSSAATAASEAEGRSRGATPGTNPDTRDAVTPRFADAPSLGASGPTAQPVSLGPAERQVLRSWLDQELSARGLEAIPTEPADSDLTDTERRQILNLVSDAMSRQETEFRMYLNDLISALETRQQQQMTSTLTTVYENLEAERRDAVFMLASQLGLLEVNHGEELALTNAKLDYLLSQITVPAAEERSRQENR